MTAPCLKRLDADCFRSQPAWAKRAFAYRLVHLLTPKPLTKRLPGSLRLALIAPGVDIPPGLILPDGMVVSPGAEFPAGWSPADPVPPGVIPAPTVPPGVEESGSTPPTYVTPWEPGPIRFGSVVTVAGALYTITSDSTDGRVNKVGSGWANIQAGTSGNTASWTDWQSNVATQARMGGIDYFTITRSFFTFDLSTLPSKTAKIVQLKLYEYQRHASSVVVQEHLHDGVAHTHDYASFKDPEFGYMKWAAGDNTITFNTAGLAYITGVLGSTAKLCVREYEHDFLNDPPTGYQNFRNGFYYSEKTTAELVPRLLIQL